MIKYLFLLSACDFSISESDCIHEGYVNQLICNRVYYVKIHYQTQVLKPKIYFRYQDKDDK